MENTSVGAKQTFNCTISVQPFSTKGNFNRHQADVHNLPNSEWREKLKDGFRCTICDETFTLKSNLTRHCKQVHSSDDNANKVACPSCEELFTRNLYNQNLYTKHQGK